MNSRVIWRRAHPVRLPSRDTAVHEELRAARTYDLIRQQQKFEDEFAYELDRELQEIRT